MQRRMHTIVPTRPLVQYAAALLMLCATNAMSAGYDCMMEARQSIEIRSPVEAIIESVKVRRGDRVARGQVLVTLESGATSIRNPIMKLAEIDPLHVELVLPVSLYGKIKLGQQAIVMPEAPLVGRLKSTASIIDRVLDAASGTFGVRMILPNTKGEIPAGVRCKANFSQWRATRFPLRRQSCLPPNASKSLR